MDGARVPVQAPWQRAQFVHILLLPGPRTRELDFAAAFAGDAATQAALARLSVARKEILIAHERSYADAALKVRASSASCVPASSSPSR